MLILRVIPISFCCSLVGFSWVGVKRLNKLSVFSLLGVSLLLLCLVYPASAVGIFRNSEANWYLDYNNTGTIDKIFHFGSNGDVPVIGDWNKNGTSDVAIFRPSTGFWYFDYNLDGTVDKSFRYGGSTDRTVVGDWDGDGADGIAIFRPSTGYWYFDYNLDGVINKSFRYGGSTDQIITGDWDGDGIDGIAIFRPSTGYWYFDYNLDGNVDKSFRYGGSTDRIVKGDWDGDGKDGIAIFRPSTGYWYFDYNLDGNVDKSFRYGGSTDQIITGDWQGTGQDGIAIFRPSTGYWYIDYNVDGKIDKSFRYGGSADRIVVGNWISVAPSLAPVAAFTADVQSGTAPLTVTFTDQSTGTAPLTYAWDFTNDGVNDSTTQSPSYTYSAAGTYSVRLTVANAAGSDPETKTSYITVSMASVAPVAAFTTDVQSGTAPLTVTFTDQSTGTAPLTYTWDFNNDGDVDSEQSNPTFMYVTAGTYTVRLVVTNSAGSDSEIKYSFITVNEVPAAPVADFITNKRSGNAPLTVRFTDSSIHTPTSWAWDFDNNGVVDSTCQNPTFTYSTPDTYSVKLTVTNSLGTDEVTKTDYITVNEGQSGGSHAGIALTFDDNSIDQWYAIRGMLQQYNAHVTFFVTGYGNLDQNQIDRLLELQNVYGHEIGFHGTYHTEAGSFIQNPPTVQDYIDYDIIPGLNQMRNDGFNVVDFAYPGGSDNADATVALQAYFGHVRDTYYTWDDEINYEYGSNEAFIKGIGIDDLSYGNTIEDIYNGISTAEAEDKILITYGHIPVQTVTADYQTSYDRLEKILIYVTENNMKFYTVSELD